MMGSLAFSFCRTSQPNSLACHISQSTVMPLNFGWLTVSLPFHFGS